MQTPLNAILGPSPFNPGSPVDPGDFVGRIQEIESFRYKLAQTSEGSLASMSVAGGYGIGKTSFLHKCKTIAEENNALTIYFSLSELDTLDINSLSRMLVERLKEKVREEVVLHRISNLVFDALKKVKITINGSLELVHNGESSNSFPTLHSALSAAWNELKGPKKAIVFLIDEAGVLEKNKAQLILYLRAVLEHLQTQRVPVMIVISGKFTVNVSSGSGFSPLVRTFPPSILENFSNNECNVFVRKRLDSKGVTIGDDLLEVCYRKTEGHPFVLSAYMASAYSKLTGDERELKKNHFEAADIDFVKRILAHFFSRFYDNVGKTSKSILEVMANSGGEIEMAVLCKKLSKQNNKISPFLAKLTQDGAIIRTERGKYKLFHKLFGEYIKERSG